MLRKILKRYRLSSFGQFVLKHRFAFEAIIGFLFGGAILSIPLCSFRTNLYYVTWALTLPLLLLSVLYFLLWPVKFGLVSFSLLGFPLFALISSSLNRFQGFVFTPILLSLVTLVLFMVSRTTKSLPKIFLFAAFVAAWCFGIIYFVTFRKEIISGDFDRLGAAFGDINDIAICISVGAILSVGYFFTRKHLLLKIGSVVSFGFFCILGISTGSKIFYFIVVVCVITAIFLFFGKKKVLLSCFLVLGVIVFGFAILSLPFLSVIRERLFLFISTLFNPGSASRTDYGTVFRMDMINSALNLWLRKPLFGFGVFGYSQKSGLNAGWSHNHFSEILCNYGLIGFVCFHFPFLYAFRGKENKRKEASFLSLLILVLFLVCMLSVALDSEKIFAYLVGVPYGCLCADPRPVRMGSVLKSRREASAEDLFYDRVL